MSGPSPMLEKTLAGWEDEARAVLEWLGFPSDRGAALRNALREEPVDARAEKALGLLEECHGLRAWLAAERPDPCFVAERAMKVERLGLELEWAVAVPEYDARAAQWASARRGFLFRHPEGRPLVIPETELAYDARAGKTTHEAGKRGHEQVHGSEEEKQKRRQRYQADLEEKLATNPRLSLTDARRSVAKDYGVSAKTVQRHTTNPRPK